MPPVFDAADYVLSVVIYPRTPPKPRPFSPPPSRHRFVPRVALLLLLAAVLPAFLSVPPQPVARAAPDLPQETFLGYSLGTAPLTDGLHHLSVQNADTLYTLTLRRAVAAPLDAKVFLFCQGTQAFVRTPADAVPSLVHDGLETVSCTTTARPTRSAASGRGL